MAGSEGNHHVPAGMPQGWQQPHPRSTSVALLTSSTSLACCTGGRCFLLAVSAALIWPTGTPTANRQAHTCPPSGTLAFNRPHRKALNPP